MDKNISIDSSLRASKIIMTEEVDMVNIKSYL